MHPTAPVSSSQPGFYPNYLHHPQTPPQNTFSQPSFPNNPHPFSYMPLAHLFQKRLDQQSQATSGSFDMLRNLPRTFSDSFMESQLKTASGMTGLGLKAAETLTTNQFPVPAETFEAKEEGIPAMKGFIKHMVPVFAIIPTEQSENEVKMEEMGSDQAQIGQQNKAESSMLAPQMDEQCAFTPSNLVVPDLRLETTDDLIKKKMTKIKREDLKKNKERYKGNRVVEEPLEPKPDDNDDSDSLYQKHPKKTKKIKKTTPFPTRKAKRQ